MVNQEKIIESSDSSQQPKPKKHLLKKIFISLAILIAILVVLEVNNYSQYVNGKNSYYDNYPERDVGCPFCFTPLPTYRPLIVQIFYKIFPSLDKQTLEEEYGAHPDEPIIYLYPQTKEQVSVQLNYGGIVTDTYPQFDDQKSQTWNVTAFPSGRLIDSADGKEYSYLFWEGADNNPYDLSTGFVVKGSDTASFLQTQLSKMGLTPKEYNEFIVYWLPKLEHNPYNLIHFAGDEYTNFAKLNISPKPDSLLRVFMVYKPLNQPVTISPQTFPSFNRNGFSVVEWGGELAK